MPETVLTVAATIHAPIERVFALSTRVELVQQTLGMQLVAGGITTGHITANSRVHWRGWKFGLPTSHHTLITAFEPPHSHFMRLDHTAITKEAFFQDTQERGRFATFHHNHLFRERLDGGPLTEVRDEIHFALPFGPLGAFIAKHIMTPHILRLANARFALIKRLAEGEGWHQWINPLTE
jgi:ligand-binding SRPBCC domain-containing protein